MKKPHPKWKYEIQTESKGGKAGPTTTRTRTEDAAEIVTRILMNNHYGAERAGIEAEDFTVIIHRRKYEDQ